MNSSYLLTVVVLLCSQSDAAPKRVPINAERELLISSGDPIGVHFQSSGWKRGKGYIEGTGKGQDLIAGRTIAKGSFHIAAQIRLVNQEGSAASFFLDNNHFGFEGARKTIFTNGTIFGDKVKLYGSPVDFFKRGEWFEFEAIGSGDKILFRLNGHDVLTSKYDGNGFRAIGLRPWRSTMQVRYFAVAGDTKAVADRLPREYTIPTLDLADQKHRQVIVDREEGQYLGHPTTLLLEDGKTMLCVYPKGHGRGAIVYKRSNDGGRTWSERLPTPESWATSKEVPTLHRVIDAAGKKRIIMFSGLYPCRMAVTEDDGKSWSELEPVGDWGGIVQMGCVEELKSGKGHYMAMFHDDGRFFTKTPQRKNPVVFKLYKTFSKDGGLTWSYPEVIQQSSDVHLCEPGIIRSPDGKQLAVLLRENSRRRNSFVIFSDDEGKSWTEPRELPAALTGDRHTGKYAPDGRLFISFRDTTHVSSTKGDWVAWVGTYEDIVKGREGQYRVRLMDNHKGGDCAYPGVEVLADGTFVTTTYGHWIQGKSPYIVSVRLRLEELDKIAKESGN